MDEFDNLFTDEAVTETVENEVTETVEEAVEEVEETAEAVEDTEETVEETVADTVVEPVNEAPQTVPVAVLISERNRAKQAEQELRLIRDQMAAQAAAQTQLVDPYDDPQTYHAQQMELMRAQIREEMRIEKLNSSIVNARDKHGQEMLDEIADWAESMAAIDPSFEARAFAQPDPVEWTIAERKRIEQRQLFETDPDAFVRQRAMELGLTATQSVAAQTTITETRKASAGPKSIVHASSRDGITNKSGKDDFDALFDK